ncbi:hypothetical protein E5083_14785 [Streptomyces bauhiniae]|uniref:Uncharacterized protein n=1 Tax=Streptomyces bauhiniae TaxID=2340725 RepID=A0A4Z1D3L3_9ACTN|nr:hypothetical protein [Streptomyces bauhiniae]TGN76457.1 hypothetical protein E5083_14785 [Streptomyces bauhiniae]
MTGLAPVDDDRRRLATVYAVPIILLTLVSAYFCWTALTIRPAGTWDDDAYAGIVLACVMSVGAAGVAAAVWVLPGVRRVLGWGWVGPALVLGAVAGVRWATGG